MAAASNISSKNPPIKPPPHPPTGKAKPDYKKHSPKIAGLSVQTGPQFPYSYPPPPSVHGFGSNPIGFGINALKGRSIIRASSPSTGGSQSSSTSGSQSSDSCPSTPNSVSSSQGSDAAASAPISVPSKKPHFSFANHEESAAAPQSAAAASTSSSMKPPIDWAVVFRRTRGHTPPQH
ncbi:MAG TPA: hypothetical protein VGM34_00920 [Chlamydiales bacterium]|jgi:hypothetical protein